MCVDNLLFVYGMEGKKIKRENVLHNHNASHIDQVIEKSYGDLSIEIEDFLASKLDPTNDEKWLYQDVADD